MPDDSVLEIDGLSVLFGGLRALSSYSVRVRSGELLGIIGPNGAGKTTLFNAITGFIKPSSGAIHFMGRSILGLRPDLIAKAGVARTFQNICLFRDLSVLDNVRIAGQLRRRTNLLDVVFSLPRFHRYEKNLVGSAMDLLSFFGLEQYKNQRARNLAYGDQRKLEIARAIATLPRLLLLDEPSAGMNPKETERLMELLVRVKAEFSLTVVLIEHNMRLVMPLCERLQVLNYGQIIKEGTPETIQHDPVVIAAYLGGDTVAASN